MSKQPSFQTGGWKSYGQYMQDKQSKLLNQAKPTSKDGIFKGLTFWQTGRTFDIDVRRLVNENGGTFLQYGLRNVSHIVASNISTSNQQWRKLINGGVNRTKFHIVTPQWVVDCLEQRKLLKENLYLPEELKGTSALFFGESNERDSSNPGISRSRSRGSRKEDFKMIEEIANQRDMVVSMTRKINPLKDLQTCLLEICNVLHKRHSTFKSKGGFLLINEREDSVSYRFFDASRSSVLEEVMKICSNIGQLQGGSVTLGIYVDCRSVCEVSVLPNGKHDHAREAFNDFLENLDAEKFPDHLKNILFRAGLHGLRAVIVQKVKKLTDSRKLHLIRRLLLETNRILSKIIRGSNIFKDSLILKCQEIFKTGNRGCTIKI
jgi:BRCT domain, a BRCA1 C-terminus domain